MPRFHMPVEGDEGKEVQDARKVFENADVRSTPWHRIAGALRTLEAHSVSDSQGRPWAYKAQQATGLSYIQLREVTRCHETASWLAETGRYGLDQIYESLGKHHIELISRIRKIDEAASRGIFERAMKEPMTIAVLRRVYSSLKQEPGAIKSTYSWGRQLATNFENDCIEAISATTFDKRDLFVNVEAAAAASRFVLGSETNLKHVKPSLVISAEVDGRSVARCAVECAMASQESDQYVVRRLKSVAFDASHYDAYVLFVPDRSFDRVRETLSSLGVVSVRLGCVKPDRTIDLSDPHTSPTFGVGS